MKRIKNLCILAFAAFFIACESENPAPEPVYNSCRLTKYYTAADTAQSSTHFHYDNAGRLIRISEPGPGGITWGTNIIYEANAVKVEQMDNPAIYSRYYLTADSLAYASANYNAGVRTDTVTYLYENKLLKKAVRINHVFGKDSTFFTYTGNDLTLIKTYMSNGAIEQASFTYTSIPSKLWYYRNFGAYLHFDFYHPWFGKGNDHLISTFSFTYNGNPDPIQVTYTQNASGYVTKVNTLFLGTSSQANYEYACQ